MHDDTLEQLQTKIAFLERGAAELSDVVFRQHQEIQALQAQLKLVSDRLNAVPSDQSPRPAAEETPPHY
jgi:uncharacterized coiled-coil protein SlyX